LAAFTSRGRVLWLLLGAAFVVPVGIAAWVSWPPSVQTWGDISSWVAGIPTAGALLLGALAYRAQVAQAQLADDEALKQQARLVNAWGHVSDARVELVPDEEEMGTFGLTLSNRSDAPVYDLRVMMELPTGINVMLDVARVLPPGEPLRIDQIVSTDPIEQDDWNPELPLIAIRFRDANGVLWARYANGELERTTIGDGSGWGAEDEIGTRSVRRPQSDA
jgi:hypothetical protein